MTALALALIGSGIVLIWSGAKGEDVREVVRGVLTGQDPAHPSKKSTPPQGGTAGGAVGESVPAGITAPTAFRNGTRVIARATGPITAPNPYQN